MRAHALPDGAGWLVGFRGCEAFASLFSFSSFFLSWFINEWQHIAVAGLEKKKNLITLDQVGRVNLLIYFLLAGRLPLMYIQGKKEAMEN